MTSAAFCNHIFLISVECTYFFPDYISAVRTGICAYMDSTLLRSLILREFFTGCSTVLAAIMIDTSVAIYTSR